MSYLTSIIEKISSGEIAVFNRLYGDYPIDVRLQAKRYTSIINTFQSTFKHEQAELFSSPGRTEIGGNHTDHNRGRVLAAAINLDNIAIAAKNNSNRIRILSVGYPEISIDISFLRPNKGEHFSSASLVRGISARLKDLGFIIGGFDAVIDGAVPKGSGLSSSASFEVIIGTILNNLFNAGRIDPLTIALAGQFAENNYFGKPCGLMDQIACAVGGLVSIDFKMPSAPSVKKLSFDFLLTGFALVITDTGGNHTSLNEDYASMPFEMKSVAQAFGAEALRDVSLAQILDEAPALRKKTSDRALLRAIHFFGDNDRVVRQVEALDKKDFEAFLQLVIESGYSSFMYNQNIYSSSNVKEQGVSLALALSEMVLKGYGAWRVHGGGFAGTIQAFVPYNLLDKYTSTLEKVFGKGACKKLFIRDIGAVQVSI